MPNNTSPENCQISDCSHDHEADVAASLKAYVDANTEYAERAAFIHQMLSIADWYGEHTELPVPHRVTMAFDEPKYSGDEATRVQRVKDFADRMGVTVFGGSNYVSTHVKVGPQVPATVILMRTANLDERRSNPYL